jgi:hypothetical protein
VKRLTEAQVLARLFDRYSSASVARIVADPASFPQCLMFVNACYRTGQYFDTTGGDE